MDFNIYVFCVIFFACTGVRVAIGSRAFSGGLLMGLSIMSFIDDNANIDLRVLGYYCILMIVISLVAVIWGIYRDVSDVHMVLDEDGEYYAKKYKNSQGFSSYNAKTHKQFIEDFFSRHFEFSFEKACALFFGWPFIIIEWAFNKLPRDHVGEFDFNVLNPINIFAKFIWNRKNK